MQDLYNEIKKLHEQHGTVNLVAHLCDYFDDLRRPQQDESTEEARIYHLLYILYEYLDNERKNIIK